MIKSILLIPIQFIILLFLHLIFAFSRLLTLISILPSLLTLHLTSTPTNTTNNTIEELKLDLNRWKKTPNHLAIVCSPGKNFTWNYWNQKQTLTTKRERKELIKLIKDVKLLIGWCEELSVSSLSIYDETGILERNSSTVLKELAQDFPIVTSKETITNRTNAGCTSFKVQLPKLRFTQELESAGRETDSVCSVSDVEDPISTASSTTLVNSSTPLNSTSSAHLSVNLLSRLSGRPHLAEIAKEIAIGLENGSIDRKRLDRGLVEETIEASVVAEPDLLLVLGGPYLRLRGFPPWQLRLTEMYHHSSPSWLPTPPISYTILRNALDVYGGAEMRLGR